VEVRGRSKSAALREFVESLERVRMRRSADHALATFVNSAPSDEELELAAEHFAHWLHQWGQPHGQH
jgi:hypothetical protein